MPANSLNILLLLGASQGIFIIYLLWKKKWENALAVKTLVALLIIVTGLLLGRIALTIPNVHPWTFFFLLPDVILFLIGPLLYFFIRALLRQGLPDKPNLYYHFIPAILHILVLIGILISSSNDFSTTTNLQAVVYLFYFIEGAAIISMLFYFLGSIRYFQKYKMAFYQKYTVPFLGDFLQFFGLAAGVLFFIWSIGFIRKFFLPTPDYQIYILAWFTLVVMIYALATKIAISPTLLSLPILKQSEEEVLKSDIPADILEKLGQFMETEKPFLNASLKIGDLAKELNLPQNELSKLINKGFNKNFFEFINEYRIKEFIKLRMEAKHAHFTTLSLAYQAGFNSKSAFNRAFRKSTGKSPRNYFKQQHQLMSRKSG